MQIRVKINDKYKGPVLADFAVGVRVRRSKRWRWHDQDEDRNGVPTDGIVTEIRTIESYPIIVTWDCGRYGHGYDPIDLIIIKKMTA